MKIDIFAFFLPRVIQLFIFFYWSNIVLPNLDAQDNASFAEQNTACSYLMNIISLYILIMDIPRLLAAPKLYVKSVTSFVNLTVLFLILINSVD
jgi:succinate-acetate transporter protein